MRSYASRMSRIFALIVRHLEKKFLSLRRSQAWESTIFPFVSIIEKPKEPKSNRAVIGIYFFDNKVIKYAKQVKPSWRNELEMSCIHNAYLKDNSLRVEELNRGVTWIDAGTFDSLLMASNVISNIEKIQNYKISCPEEISFRNGWINKNELEKLAQSQIKSGYGKYLKRVLEGL